MDLFTVYAMIASMQAMRDAGLEGAGALDPERTGIMLGVGFGGVQAFENAWGKLNARAPAGVEPLFIPKMMANSPVGQLAIKYGITGPSLVVASACTSATDAIGRALRCIRAGLCDVMITGGAEALLSPICFAGFGNLQALTTSFNDTPERASRPFDKDRSGFVLAEGAGVLVIESAEHAAARGAPVYAELAGYGATCDAHHLTAPQPEGLGAQSAMRMAMRTGGLEPHEVDYVNAHGTSTPLNDPVETAAIKGVFGEHAYRLKVSSTKSMVGHLLGGSGGVEAVVTIKALHEQFYPPTANLEEPDPACDLDYVPQRGVAAPMRGRPLQQFRVRRPQRGHCPETRRRLINSGPVRFAAGAPHAGPAETRAEMRIGGLTFPVIVSHERRRDARATIGRRGVLIRLPAGEPTAWCDRQVASLLHWAARTIGRDPDRFRIRPPRVYRHDQRLSIADSEFRLHLEYADPRQQRRAPGRGGPYDRLPDAAPDPGRRPDRGATRPRAAPPGEPRPGAGQGTGAARAGGGPQRHLLSPPARHRPLPLRAHALGKLLGTRQHLNRHPPCCSRPRTCSSTCSFTNWPTWSSSTTRRDSGAWWNTWCPSTANTRHGCAATRKTARFSSRPAGAPEAALPGAATG